MAAENDVNQDAPPGAPASRPPMADSAPGRPGAYTPLTAYTPPTAHSGSAVPGAYAPPTAHTAPDTDGPPAASNAAGAHIPPTPYTPHAAQTPPTPYTPRAAQTPPPAQPPPTHTPSAPAAPREPHASIVLLERIGRWVCRQLARPRTRTTAVGLLLILIGAEVVTSSVWTFPLLIVGILMVVIAWVGSRLEGRFAVEWSELGAGFEMRARFKSATEAPPPPRPSLPPKAPATPAPTLIAVDEAVTDADPVIEGESHTIEIDLEELRALLEAAERGTPNFVTTTKAPVSWQQSSDGIERSGRDAGSAGPV